MRIRIESLRFDAIIGLLDFEREREQLVRIDIEADYNYKEGSFVDYAALVETVEKRVKHKRYLLLEEALLDLKIQIVTLYPEIKKLHISIAKPDILKHCTVSLSQSWEL
jgi:dihydroneopterin aldolase